MNVNILPAELIKKKRNGLEHTELEIRTLIERYCSGDLPDYQMSAWLMAVFFKGMTAAETSHLTRAMLESGRTLNFAAASFSHGFFPVDKHSTGGVGDKTTMVLAPIVAAAGVPVPMIAGRGLGHTGGTLDKLEAIPGFRIGLSLEEFTEQVRTLGLAIIGQTREICPADKKIYALRDVTATVESLPLICASIMSKKLAEGIGALVLDVKYGSGAFMKTLSEAETLATKLMEIGAAHGKKVAALLTNMEQPLGRFIGNALEIGECQAILKQESYLGHSVEEFSDTMELSLELAGHMIWLGGRTRSAGEGIQLAREILLSGKAWAMWEKLCLAQGGDLKSVPLAKTKMDVLATETGFVTKYETEKIGIASLVLGAGRIKTSDEIDDTAGIYVHRKIGDPVQKGQPLFTLYANHSLHDARFEQVKGMLLPATLISLQKVEPPALITMRKVH